MQSQEEYSKGLGTHAVQDATGFPGQIHRFASGATRDDDTTKLDPEGFLSPHALEAYFEYMHRHRFLQDGTLRASDNWQKGIPRWRYVKSLWRHFFEFWTLWRKASAKRGEVNIGGEIVDPDDLDGRITQYFEEKLCAILFNVFGLLHELRIGRSV